MNSMSSFRKESRYNRGSRPAKWIIIVFCGLILSTDGFAQREHKVHDRGMLHESVFNNGILSQALKNNGIEWSAQPMFEWPGRSATIVDGIEYDGQHNSLGGGIQIAANYPGELGYSNRKFAFCGMIGSGGPETSIGVWTFPISFYEIENYPVLDDGSLNPDFDPSEAEQIISAEWATSLGITVRRVTRSYSYPDFDDIVFHEYEFEFTGNTDMDPNTIEMDTVDTLVDVLIYFAQSFAPSMYGYQRHYNQWKWKPGIFNGDNWASFDPDYWLAFNMDMETNGDYGLAGKPELSKELFLEFATTGKNGGGFGSPAAVGYTMLYYDRNHLVEFNGPEMLTDSSIYEPTENELDAEFRLKQPYHTFVTHGWFSSAVIISQGRPQLRTDSRADGFFNDTEVADWGLDNAWLGRGQYAYEKSDYPGRSFAFGPYALSKGDILEYSFAQVAGYGADPTKEYWGGHQKSDLWGPVPDMNREVEIDGEVLTEHYLDDFGYPDYVNSEVRTVNDVARKAWEAYTGNVIPHDSTWAAGELICWPEDNESDGNYFVPMPYPAPAVTIENLDNASVYITWGTAVRSFTHAEGELQNFNIYRSIHPTGPWQLLKQLSPDSLNSESDLYEFVDDDPEFKIGDYAFYAVTSVNDQGMESGKTNITRIQKNIGSVPKLGKVYVIPNPFYLNSGFSGIGTDEQIGFYGLSEKCTIHIFSYAGQLIQEIEHDERTYSESFHQTTLNHQVMAPGIYFFVVTTPEGDRANGKFVVIK